VQPGRRATPTAAATVQPPLSSYVGFFLKRAPVLSGLLAKPDSGDEVNSGVKLLLRDRDCIHRQKKLPHSYECGI